MIVSLEGPDKSGKSALFHALQGRLDATFVPSIPITRDVFAIIDQVEVCFEHLWRRLYDQSKLYVVDRHMQLSNIVYGRLYGRKIPQQTSFWRKESLIFYLDCPLDVLRARYRATGDELFDEEKYVKLVALYREEVRRWNYVRLDATKPTSDLVEQVCATLGA